MVWDKANENEVNVNIIVKTSTSTLEIDGNSYPCAMGKNGITSIENSREGDGMTPLGHYPLRYGLYRDDRICIPPCTLQFHQIRKNDGWCDTPHDDAYNRPVRLPYPTGAESLYKDSHVYDIIIVLGHNDTPPIPDMGSAIFLHIARDGYQPTQGCVAIHKDDMLELLPQLTPETTINIIA